MRKITKTIPLVSASLKEFVRNWKSVCMLLLLPLLIIGSFFASFSTSGLQKIPVGIISQQDVELEEFENLLSGILITNKFDTLEDCMEELRKYNQYACIDVKKDRTYRIEMHYDNTRTLVIWGVINQVKSTIDYIKKQKTIEVTSKILEQVETGPQYIDEIQNDLAALDNALTVQTRNIDNSVQIINSGLISIETGLDSLNTRVSNINSKVYSLGSDKVVYSNSIKSSLNTIDGYGNQLIALGPPSSQYGTSVKSNTNLIKSNINNYDSKVDSAANNILLETNQISLVENTMDSSSSEIRRKVSEIQSINWDLKNKKTYVGQARDDLDILEEYFSKIEGISPEEVADPIKLSFQPTYLPDINPDIIRRFQDKEQDEITRLIKGETLLSFQVIFPKILLLIVMFISLLTSSFVCLNYIKSPATARLNTIKGMFFPSFFSIYIASSLITLIPIVAVVLLGNFLFLLPFVENLWIVCLILILTISINVLLGMGVSYLIKDKTLTLLVSIFMLLFLLFFSGFILPIERMGASPAKIATNFPGNIGTDALNKLLFYDQPFSSLKINIISLMIILFLLCSLILFIKKIREI